MSRKQYRCLNCGADYEPSCARCPYCGQENPDKAQEQYQAKITRLRTDRKNLQKLPGHISRKLGSRLFAVIIGLVLCVIVIGVLAGIATGIHKKQEVKRQRENIEQMEELLQAHDYEGLRELYDKVEDYYIVYHKYEEVVWVYNRLVWMEEFLELWEEDPTEDIWDLISALQYWQDLRELAQEYLGDSSRMANEEYLEELLQMAEQMAKERIPAEEALLDEIAAVDEEDYEKRTALYEAYAREIMSLGNGG